MVAGMIALVVLIQGTVAIVRGSVLVRLPLAESQEVRFDEPGTVSLAMEGPQGSTRFARVGRRHGWRQHQMRAVRQIVRPR